MQFSSITENLNPQFPLRPYQKEALNRLAERLNRSDGTTRLLFYMATGSGKTLVMAGSILELYQRGYRRFVFFVNSTSIIEKTRDNFLNPGSSKYLFDQEVVLNGRRVRLREVNNFSSTHPDDISIVFTTIQGLHSRLHTPRENSLTLEDLHEAPLVLLSDEAHHINADTKRGKKQPETFDDPTWEASVEQIFRGHPQNVLLEFTATIDLENEFIREKYQDRIVFDYSLRQFRQDKYSKEVKLLQTDLPPFERALTAIILSFYRESLFREYGMALKSVVLLKSKTIRASREFYEEFHRRLKNLRPADIERLDLSHHPVLAPLPTILKGSGVSLEAMIGTLQMIFSPEASLVVNSKDDSEAKQLLVNSLEDPDNPYQLIFAVNKLDEGWDVLNLFDIVRLYDTRDAGRGGEPGKTTLSEAQLIGRGARYFPFRRRDQPKESAFQRKFDDQLRHPLRLGEELYYHAPHNPRYISELTQALVKTGIRPAARVKYRVSVRTELVKSYFYQYGWVPFNHRASRLWSPELFPPAWQQPFRYRLRTGAVQVQTAFGEPETVEVSTAAYHRIPLAQIPPPIVRKALNRLPFFRFNRLKNFLPRLSSMREFVTDPLYLGTVVIEFTGEEEQITKISPEEQLRAVIGLLERTRQNIHTERTGFQGTSNWSGEPMKRIFRAKIIQSTADRLVKTGKYVEQAWCGVESEYTTHIRREFAEVIAAFQQQLPETTELWLLETHAYIKLYDLPTGEAVAPDFYLFLRDNATKKKYALLILLGKSRRFQFPEKEEKSDRERGFRKTTTVLQFRAVDQKNIVRQLNNLINS